VQEPRPRVLVQLQENAIGSLAKENVVLPKMSGEATELYQRKDLSRHKAALELKTELIVRKLVNATGSQEKENAELVKMNGEATVLFHKNIFIKTKLL